MPSKQVHKKGGKTHPVPKVPVDTGETRENNSDLEDLQNSNFKQLSRAGSGKTKTHCEI